MEALALLGVLPVPLADAGADEDRGLAARPIDVLHKRSPPQMLLFFHYTMIRLHRKRHARAFCPAGGMRAAIFMLKSRENPHSAVARGGKWWYNCKACE